MGRTFFSSASFLSSSFFSSATFLLSSFFKAPACCARTAASVGTSTPSNMRRCFVSGGCICESGSVFISKFVSSLSSCQPTSNVSVRRALKVGTHEFQVRKLPLFLQSNVLPLIDVLCMCQHVSTRQAGLKRDVVLRTSESPVILTCILGRAAIRKVARWVRGGLLGCPG